MEMIRAVFVTHDHADHIKAVGSEKVYGKLDLKDDIDEVIECIQQTLPFTIEKRDTSIYLNK